jgi:hypothetical protein
LICKEVLCNAYFLSTQGLSDAGLSHPALDNGVDKSGQVLYGRAKSLICKDIPRIACVLSTRPAHRAPSEKLFFS